ncbi:hypothetical protein ACS0TY_013580 [Phlomoides rotata]
MRFERGGQKPLGFVRHSFPDSHFTIAATQFVSDRSVFAIPIQIMVTLDSRSAPYCRIWWPQGGTLCELKTIVKMDNASTLASRVKKTDAREIESFYKRYFENYVLALKKGAQLGKVYVTAGMLFKVLCAVNKTGKVKEVAPEMVVDLGTGLPWMMCKQDDAPSPIKLNRKLVHITVGLTFMLYWPMFCSGRQGAMLAAIMPAANIIKMLLIGLGISKDDVTVKSMSRFGDHRLFTVIGMGMHAWMERQGFLPLIYKYRQTFCI